MIKDMHKVFQVEINKDKVFLEFIGNENCFWVNRINKHQVIELANDLLAIADEMTEEVKNEAK